jgi:hypothetical protein
VKYFSVLIAGLLLQITSLTLAQGLAIESTDAKFLASQITEYAHIKQSSRVIWSHTVLRIFGSPCIELKVQIRKFCEKTEQNFDAEFRKNLTEKQFFKAIQDTYEKEFTTAELQRIYRFYSDPVITKIDQKLSRVLTDNSSLELSLLGGKAFMSALQSTEKEMGSSLTEIAKANP